MAAIKMILALSLAVLFFAQLAMCVPSRFERSAEDSSEEKPALKQVEAKVTVAVEDLKKGLQSMFQNISAAIQTEMAKHPEANQLYNNLYSNVTDGVADLIKTFKDNTGAPAPASA